MRVFIILIITTFYSCFVLAELPSGNATIAGDISITSNDQSMTIQQQSDQAIIEWNSFNIGENNTVTFNQPSSSSSALNRVISGNPTTLAGSLNANGKVYVVNENGVYFHQLQQSMHIRLLPQRLLSPMIIFSIIFFLLVLQINRH